MNWFKRFMTGRYGGDQLSTFLLILSILLTLITQIARIPLFTFIAYIPLGICIFRMLSRNTQKRSMENYRYSMLVSPVYAWFRKKKKRLSESRTHRFYKCPECKAELRLPKGKGKIIIICPRCKKEFKSKS